jgi:GAF domain
MAHQGLQALPARDLVVPSSSAASVSGPVASDGLVAELLPYWRPDLPTHGSDFQSFVRQVVELAKILTGASGSAIAFRGEQGTICQARSGEGAPPLGAPVDTTSGISKQCLDSGTSLRCEDIVTDGRVDPEISQAIGIRAVAVVPIYSDGGISGILEVFSSTPGIFTDQHLKRLQQLADWVGSAANTPSEKPICGSNVDVQLNGHPDITLLVELEPAYRAFFRNLADLVSLRSPARLARSSSQMHGWNDVLVDSHIPWQGFLESVFLHIVVAGMLSGLSRISSRELLVSPRPLREAHVTYYPFSQSFPARGSSRPAVHPRGQHTSAHQEVIRTSRDREPRGASGTRGTDDGQKIRALTTPPPAMPMFAISRLRKPGLGAETSVLPPPDIDEAEARQSHLPNFPVIAPPPDFSGGSGLRVINAPRAVVVPPSPDARVLVTSSALIDRGQRGRGSAGVADISIVPPAPSLNDRAVLTYTATGVISTTGVQVVAPPPSVQVRAKGDAAARAISLGGGVSQVVLPPPSLDGAGNSGGGGRGESLAASSSQVVPPPPSMQNGGSFGGGGRANSLADGGSQVVPPPPSLQNGGNYGGGGRISSLGHAASQVVPPPPSVQFGAGGNSGAGARASSLARARAEGVLPPASAQGEGNSKLGGARVAKDVSTSSVPEAGVDRMHPIFQDVQLRVIGLAWAPPRSSYFSNFEVFIAEKWLNKKVSQFIKLVYVFLPYQRRLSEYGPDGLKVRRLRVTRDSTCDESLMQMMWPEGENGPTGSHHSGDALASPSTDRNDVLPCYRTTADDYQRAVSRSR